MQLSPLKYQGCLTGRTTTFSLISGTQSITHMRFFPFQPVFCFREQFEGSQLPKKRSRFCACSCYRIYRVKVVGLSLSNHTFKITILVSICKIWGNFVKNWYFVNNHLFKVLIWKSFCTYVTYEIVIIYRTPHSLLLQRF